ncbi:MAG TPA: hypothetical protein VGM01_14190 [Ktedonobacteraceae bacterium]
MKHKHFIRLWWASSFVVMLALLSGCNNPFQSTTNNQNVTPSSQAANSFVTRSGSQLLLNGQPFRFAGPNIYWLGLEENTGSGICRGVSKEACGYPSQFQVNDALATAKEMGATVVRAHSLGVSVGCSLCIEPSLGHFNATALKHVDYAIKMAGEMGLRLVIPLVDNYHYYHGGKHTFTDWRGISNENQFYTNKTVINDFEQYISTILNHVNSYTGIAYKDDPTILAWEEGNELTNVPVSWVSTLADYLKSIDPHHLVAFGAQHGLQSSTLSVANLDIEDEHEYPRNSATLNSDAATVIAQKKAFYVGEFDWSKGQASGDANSLSSFLSAIETDGAVGDTFWSLFPHSDSHSYVQHNDGYTLHYPGDTSNMRARAQLLRTHAYKMAGKQVSADGIPGSPLITSVVGKKIAWRGTAFASTYSIERSLAGASGPWTLICKRCVTDNGSPWSDKTQPSTVVWYRVQAFNRAGVAGSFSTAYKK